MLDKDWYTSLQINRLISCSNKKDLTEWNEYVREEMRMIMDGNIDLSGLYLRKANFRGGKLLDSNLSKADLKGADLRGANLNCANIVEADLGGADLEAADLGGAQMKRTRLDNTRLVKTVLICADLRNSDLRNADLSGAQLQDADFTGANLEGAILNGSELEGACFNSANLKSAYIGRTNLGSADLKDAILSEARLENSNLSGADLTGANLSGAGLSWANLGRANLTSACLKNVTLLEASLVGTDLTGATLTGSWLYGTARDDWKIDDIKCDYIYWSFDRSERYPKDRLFKTGEFEDHYKSLPEITFYFSDDFTPITPLIMDKVVNLINKKQPQIELKLDSFHSRGTHHAVFTILHKEQAGVALSEIKKEYEKTIYRLEGKIEGLQEAFSQAIEKSQSFTIERVDHMGNNFGNINSGRDINIATNDATINISNIESSVVQNDFNSLADALGKLNVLQEDCSELKNAIESDQGAPEHKDQTFGKNVSQWFSNMSMKARSTAWRFAEGTTAGTAAGIILNTLKAYYGWS